MRIGLDINKSLEANASLYYDKAKKAKKKLEGAQGAIDRTIKKIGALKEKKDEMLQSDTTIMTQPQKKEWFEKFRWFLTSTKFLVIGGRDATTNEIVIKKHTDPHDIVMHTDMAGSPFFVIKSEGKEIDKQTLKEVADACCSFSRAWKLGLSTQQVFYVKPDQVTKQANPGEYLAKGAFMIRGKTNYIENNINCAIGMTKKGKIMAGPLEAIKEHCKEYLVVSQGDQKSSDIAKKIKAKVGGELDDIIRALPSGGINLE
ncbi:MAG: NFACT RNA binding domain-containing protein [Candidatus Woesearchaeota archaeon]|jgi:predicted ribosome quality control (RQC) complex YloA/Tae2 family protein|nr:NFACT RNA binding domain-containing protein [Candidatus Woesearchaeota archaeon]MDP7323371.1 NFACT RNA binding domain-containing protein [Candidatus Woesearchaeota archaeon]MDP7458098.1 NFACT RNA binding domain-containing protein [Candidatus Woesearchaeota archaeon]